MPLHIVERGDTLQTIAKRYGFRQWRRIFEHPNNRALRTDRPNPDVLAPGDHVFVPPLEAKTEPARVDEKTVFVLAPVRRELVLVMREPSGTPLAGVPYTLTVDGVEHEGIIDPEGMVRHDIEVDARDAKLVLELDEKVEIDVAIGGLDPVDTDAGVRARLINLGFIAGEGEHDLAEPMALFRACHGLPALDDPLSPGAREDLLFAHGS